MKETGQEDQNTTEFHEEARTMSRDDVHHYEGVTLDEQGREEKDDISSGFHIRIHAYEGQPWWKKSASYGCGGRVYSPFPVSFRFFPHGNTSGCASWIRTVFSPDFFLREIN